MSLLFNFPDRFICVIQKQIFFRIRSWSDSIPCLWSCNSATTFSIMTFSIITLSIKSLFGTLNTNDTKIKDNQHNNTLPYVIMLNVAFDLL